ncbi:MAG: CapA family protein [Solibacillus sp.]
MSSINKVLFSVWLLLIGVFIFVVVSAPKEDNLPAISYAMEQEIELEKEPKPVEEPVIEEIIIPKETVSLAMIGDVLLHYRLATYKDFGPSFAPVAPFMQRHDYLLANQESLPVGNKYALSGYPQFSSPDYILEDLQEAGVDMINIANNHTVDKGEGGVRTLFENIDRYGIPYVGAYKSAEDASTPRIIEQKGIKIGVVSYTYGTNGLYLPKNSPFVINYIQEEKMTADIAAMKALADVTVVLIHWGPEYKTVENDNQRYLANVLNAAGADIVFGTHPHILQPYNKLTSESGQETHVFYSIGNYFSTIITMPDTMIGGIASFAITKEGDEVTIGQPQFKATSMLLDDDGVYRVYPLAETEKRSVRDLAWVQQILGTEVEVK